MTYEAFERWSAEDIGPDPDLSVVIPAFNERRRIVSDHRVHRRPLERS